jgi:hypothetical protein
MEARVTNPLLLDPIRPIVDIHGHLTNAIGTPPHIALANDDPTSYRNLLPESSYEFGGVEYLTDGESLPARVRGALRLVPASQRVRHRRAQASVSRAGSHQGRPGHGGHIVAVSLGGFASGPNLFPQASQLNLSAYSRIERGWRQALREGCSVEVDIALTIGTEPEVPSFLLVTYWEDGSEWKHNLSNEDDAL